MDVWNFIAVPCPDFLELIRVLGFAELGGDFHVEQDQVGMGFVVRALDGRCLQPFRQRRHLVLVRGVRRIEERLQRRQACVGQQGAFRIRFLELTKQVLAGLDALPDQLLQVFGIVNGILGLVQGLKVFLQVGDNGLVRALPVLDGLVGGAGPGGQAQQQGSGQRAAHDRIPFR